MVKVVVCSKSGGVMTKNRERDAVGVEGVENGDGVSPSPSD